MNEKEERATCAAQEDWGKPFQTAGTARGLFWPAGWRYNEHGCKSAGAANMIAENNIAEKAKDIYDAQLRVKLEAEHRDDFVAIEPVSGDHFVAPTFVEAALASKSAHPDRQPFVIRIGHAAAFHIGATS